MEKKNSHGMDAAMAWKAVGAAFAKLTPRAQLANPVMFLVYVSAILLTCLWVLSLAGTGDAPSGYTLAIVVMLWLTVLFLELCRGARRRSRQGAGRLAEKVKGRRHGTQGALRRAS